MAHLLLAGGGHAHLTLMTRIDQIVAQGHTVTCIGPERHHYYSGMGPGMLGGYYTPEDINFDIGTMVESRGGTFVEASITGLDADARTATLDNGQTLGWDVASFNTGSYVPCPPVELSDGAEGGEHPHLYTVKPISRLHAAKADVHELLHDTSSGQPLRLAVIGGGPGALEVGGNLRHLCNEIIAANPQETRPFEITVYAGKGFLRHSSAGIRRKGTQSLKDRGVRINEQGYVSRITRSHVELDDGSAHRAEVVFVATGVVPNPMFDDSGFATGPKGGLAVNRYLQSTSHDHSFGGGDCIHYEPGPLDKVGVYAVRQNPVLADNVMARLNGAELGEFSPGSKDYLLVFNLGDSKGLLKKSFVIFNTSVAFRIKDYIDRKFMRDFQRQVRP